MSLDAFFAHPSVALEGAPKKLMSEELASRVEAHLRHALASADGELVSLRSLARRYGISSAVFSRRFRDLSDALVRRGRTYLARQRATSEAAAELLVRRTVGRLRSEHTRVSRRMVERALPHEGLLRSPRLRAVAKEEMERIV
jgi:hypothetical protein